MPDGVPAWLKSVLKKSSTTTSTVQDVVVVDTPPVEPISLARRIQSLINKLPTPAPSTAAESSTSGQIDLHLLPSASLDDQELVQALSSPVLMNGSLDGRRTSVWRALEEMGSPTSRTSARDNVVPETFNEPSSVMVYSPLLPVRGSLVELAQSEVIIEEEEEEEHTDTRKPKTIPVPPSAPALSWTNIFTSWFTQPPQSTPPPAEPPMTPRTHEQHLRAQRAWVPSKDKLSIQCMWWGYRMWVQYLDSMLKYSSFQRFLPPPVLDILDDRQLEAARRAAMITTALTWFFNNLPSNTLPTPLRPTLLLIQQIAPFLGSIGTFISWSWSMIKAYDQGHGITLTATWLLPIALIPGTWFERDWPITPPPSDFASLPSIESVLQSSAEGFRNHAISIPHSTPTLRPDHRNLFLSSQSTPRAPDVVGTPSLPCSSINRSSFPSPHHYFGSPPLAASTPLPPSHSHFVSSPVSLGGHFDPPIGTPLSPPDVSYVAHPSSPPAFLPVSSPNSSFLSPATSFATAPSSPAPPSPKRFRASLSGFAVRSPVIRVRKSKHPASSPKTVLPALAGSSTQMTLPPLGMSVMSSSAPVAQHVHDPTLIYTHRYPSPPAHPNDIQLLQSPLWQCSPLPPEQTLH